MKVIKTEIFFIVFFLLKISFAQDTKISYSPPIIIENPSSTEGYQAKDRKFTGVPSLAISDSCMWVTWYAGITPAEDQNSYVVVATSKDKGFTWKEVLAIDPDGSGPERSYDPQAWIAPNGQLWIFWAQQGKNAGLWAITTNQPNNTNPEWSEPRRITEGTMMGKPLILSGGEWAIIPSSRDVDNSARLVISHDQGISWQERGAVNVPEIERNCDEHSVIERKNGSLWMLIRVKSGIGEGISLDAGKTWSPFTFSEIKHTNSRFFIRRLQSGNLLLVKHGPIGVKTERSHLMAFLSADDGKTWSKGLLLDERLRASYPDGQQDTDGTIYLVYDYMRTKDQHIFITSFTEDNILGSDYDSNIVKVYQQRRVVSKGGNND
ncbi:MAG: hypothetical protein A2W90_01000 [Bacteroidetes bacterium GWF2_42_66]|nr:MAG: hypothetical protein A2W92_00420 [Bacteroidetes bacterium GWA2_42_15]OFY00964.1 MAG: hypothetical protein A2W89_14490 [Bacteroidetes bacterium GWE2_42_39]OFY41804.1 MAG: hypothetical protein A2W90_01000 [Bacteroidetes bacterium GWF2_42_66]HBL78031.1 exo-alpha-sialidase [Prolixibacteraceae bacterium]HCR89854.1 exo-alpha-sialidase [Prolixibacteraceae bacterium]